MITIPNQSSVARPYEEFDEAWRMKASAYHDRLVKVMEELRTFTLLTRDRADYLVDREGFRRLNCGEPASLQDGLIFTVPSYNGLCFSGPDPD